jgi:hypothetical protein
MGEATDKETHLKEVCMAAQRLTSPKEHEQCGTQHLSTMMDIIAQELSQALVTKKVKIDPDAKRWL